MKILDTQTGTIHEYGESGHDSLHVSSDGKHLTYYNLQNGDGSGVGDYRFVCDDGKVPAESQTAEALHADVYFNIGGWPKRPQCKWISAEDELPEDMQRVLIWFEYFRYGDFNCMYQTYGFGYVCDGKWSPFINGETGWQDYNIIAWQPLPEPYEKGGEES